MQISIKFGLPPTFPPHMLPDEVVQFLNNEVVGLQPAEFVALAEEKGYQPLWKPLPTYGEGFYGFALTVNGMAIPLIVKITAGQVH